STTPRDIMGEAPWLDATIFWTVDEMLATLNAQTHRRSVKTHLPLDAFPVFEGVKVIHTVRDGRDACVSMHNHQLGMRQEVIIARMSSVPPEGRAKGPPPPTPEDPRAWYLQWMAGAERGAADDHEDLPFCEFELTYWKRRHEPWLLFVHFNDLKAD